MNFKPRKIGCQGYLFNNFGVMVMVYPDGEAEAEQKLMLMLLLMLSVMVIHIWVSRPKWDWLQIQPRI